MNNPRVLQNISCKPLLQDSENNIQEASHWEINTFHLVGREWKCIRRRRLMLCTVFLYAVFPCAAFLHRADVWARTTSYWAQMCWSLGALASCACLHWKGLTRVEGQNTAFEQVLKFRLVNLRRKLVPKRLYFLLKSKKIEHQVTFLMLCQSQTVSMLLAISQLAHSDVLSWIPSTSPPSCFQEQT